MQYRALGKSGLKVSVISFGAWQLGDPGYWGADEQADAETAVHAAIDAGVNLFDTAEMYGGGESESRLGQILGRRRNSVLIASKVSPEHCLPGKIRAACEGSLRRLKTDYIDLYQIHWPFRAMSFDAAQEELESLRQEGKIREIGLSNFGPRDLKDWFEHGRAISNQIGYNIVFRAPEYQVVPTSARYGTGVLVYMPLMQGLLTGRWMSIADIPPVRRRTRHFSSRREGVRHGERGHEELLIRTLGELAQFSTKIRVPLATICLCWLIAQPGVSSIIIGARNANQLRRNLRAADYLLGPGAMAQLNEISAPLKTRMGANADMWESEATRRIR